MPVSGEEQTPVIDDTFLDNYIESVFKPNANATPTHSHSTKIPKIQEVVGKKEDYERYYVPKQLERVQKVKPVLTMKLLEDDKETLKSLYKKLGAKEMVQHLRSHYEENSTIVFNDMEFTNMMLLDACFILYCIQSVFGGKYEDCPELNNKEIIIIHQDLFLMENQIPYIVLTKVLNWAPKINCTSKEIKSFVYRSVLATGRPKGFKWLKSILCNANDKSWSEESEWLKSLIDAEPNEVLPHHFLHLLYLRLAKTFEVSKPSDSMSSPKNVRCNFRNVSELGEIGIYFKPSDTMSKPPHIKFSRGRWAFSAYVALPPITVNDSTKFILLNLMAYETCCYHINEAWVTSYVCLLDSLIDDAEDVKVLRKAWVLENFLSSDKEAAKLFNDIACDLVPYNLAYLEAKNNIQRHYQRLRNTLFSQLKNEYFRSPWAILALLGALIALFLTGVQTYFAIWSPEGACDDLCTFLRMNHHL